MAALLPTWSLPLPPTANQMYAPAGAGRIYKRQGVTAWQKGVRLIRGTWRPPAVVPLAVTIDAQLPAALLWKIDVDNLAKPTDLDGALARNRQITDLHSDITAFVKEQFPSGSGFDAGTKFDLDTATPNKLTFIADFHHMDENGFYDGWTEHKVIVTADMAHGYSIRVTGRDRNNIKDYIADTFHHILSIDNDFKFMH